MRFRTLRRAPALAIGVVATLAVGVGALTTTFAIVNASLWRQPPFHDAGRLAVLKLVRNPIGEPRWEAGWSFARFQLLRGMQHGFEDVALYTAPFVTVSGRDDAELVHAELVSPQYFSILRARPERGRLFDAEEDDPAGPSPVAIVSHALWARRWGADPTLVGRTVRVNGVSLTVVGVLPESFHGLSGQADIWFPTTMAPRLTYAEFLTTNQNFINVVGRLRNGVTLDAARGEVARLAASINRVLPSDPEHPEERVGGAARTLNEARRAPLVLRAAVVLLAAVALLHLLACANVMNLLLGRAATRRRETAVRAALGAGRARLFRELLGEYASLAAAGTLLGVALAWRMSAFAAAGASAWAPAYRATVGAFDVPRFGAAELAFGLVVAIGTALAVALPPALTAFRLHLAREMRAGAQGISGGALRLRRPTLRGALVALEATLAVLLVVSAGLLIDSFRRMRTADVGVNTHNVLTFWVVPSDASVQHEGAASYVTRLLAAMRAVPGVVSATVDGGGPLSGTASSTLYIAGRPVPRPYEAPPILRHYVGTDHLRTLGIPLLRGRWFLPTDRAGSPPVAVISEGAARRFWPNQDPIGQRIWFGGGSAWNTPDSTLEIVGIVGNVMYDPFDKQQNTASVYTSYQQFTYPSRIVYLRTERNPLALVPAVRTALAGVDADVAMRDVRSLDDMVGGASSLYRVGAMLFGGFGAAGLLLTASGIFAVLAYVVSTRTREFGVRIALGARTPNLLALVLREGLAYPACGVVLGVVAALAATRALRSALFGVSPAEPRVYVTTITVLLLASLAACLLPAWRASRTDPMQAMRAD